MPDFDDSAYEERLRRALHQVSTPTADADAVLAGVDRGVRRRVRRHRIGAATLGVASVVAAAAIVVPDLGGDTTIADGPQHPGRQHAKRLHAAEGHESGTATVRPPRSVGKPKSARMPAGNVTEPRNLAVSSIAVNASGDVGLIGESRCADGPCIIAGSPADDVDYRVAPTHENLLEKMKLSATASAGTGPGIEVGTDASNWWAWTDAFYATHDAGKTWKPVVLPASLRVENVQSNNGRVWAFGVRPNGRSGAASATVGGHDWSTVAVRVRAGESIETPMVAGNRVAFVAADRDSARSKFVRRSAWGWTRTSVPCPTPVESTSQGSTAWLGCTTPSDQQLVAWSRDGGRNWDITLIRHRGLTAVGGVNDETAIVGVGADMLRVNATTGTVEPVMAPFSRSDDVWDGGVGYTKIRFDGNGTGYATTTGGALARTDDGGHSWRPASLP